MRTPLPVVISPEALALIDPKWRDIVAQIAALQCRDLSYWEDLPLELPPTTFTEGQLEALTGIFQAPTGDELESVARGTDGALKRLSSAQLDQLKEEGSFTVPSERYPGQLHTWTLSALLQRGRAAIRGRRRRTFAAALRQLRFQATKRIIGDHPLSLLEGVRQSRRALYHSLDLFIGLPQRHSKYDDYTLHLRLQEERRDFVREGMRPVPGCYQWTNDARTLELALQAPQLSEKVWPTLEKLLQEAQEESKRTFATRREALLAQLEEEPASSLRERLAAALQQEQQELLFTALQQSAALAAIYPALPALAANHARAVTIIHAEEQTQESTLNQERADAEEHLQREHPTLSLIPEWVEAQLAPKMSARAHDEAEATNQRIEAALQAPGLSQEAFLFSRGLAFQREQEPARRARLQAETAPAEVFTWRRRIWRAPRWKITRAEHRGGPPSFSVEKYQRQEVKTDVALWRLRNALWRTWCFLNNGLRWLLQSAWSGPLGLRALFGVAPFSAELVLDPRSGSLVPCKEKTPTFVSRLSALRRDIAHSRRSFEAKPDTGIIGKSVSRWINRAWNYFIKGLLGSLLILVGQPLLTVLSLALTSLLALSAVLWAPLGSLGVMLFNVMLYDTEAPTRRRTLPLLQRVFSLLALGVGQAVLALLCAALLHPVVALLLFLFGTAGALLRSGYDDLIRWFILKRLGRVPATSGFLARRVSGPGLSAEFYFQVRPALVLVLAQANLERLELQLYHTKTQAKLSAPLEELRRFNTQVFGLFTRYAEPAEHLTKPIEESLNRLTKALDKAVSQRSRLLDQVTTIEDPSRLRQSRQDLEETRALLVPMTQRFCEERLLPRLEPFERDAFFAERDLSRGDFVGLSEWLLSSSISPWILEPLEDADQSLRLHIEPLNLNRYLDALQQGSPIGDHLDRVKLNKRSLAPLQQLDDGQPSASALFAEDNSRAGLLYLPPETR